MYKLMCRGFPKPLKTLTGVGGWIRLALGGGVNQRKDSDLGRKSGELLSATGGRSRVEGTATVREKEKKNPTKPKVKRSPPTSNSVWVLFKEKKKSRKPQKQLFQEKDHVNKANRGNLCSECNLPTMSPGNGNPSFPVW